jgi:hypothetical protein
MSRTCEAKNVIGTFFPWKKRYRFPSNNNYWFFRLVYKFEQLAKEDVKISGEKR